MIVFLADEVVSQCFVMLYAGKSMYVFDGVSVNIESCSICPQTMLALWGSGGIKAGGWMPPARASAPAKKVAVAAVPCILAQKVSFPLQS